MGMWVEGSNTRKLKNDVSFYEKMMIFWNFPV